MLGHVSDDALAELCRRCAVFCHPSLYEGFGLARATRGAGRHPRERAVTFSWERTAKTILEVLRGVAQ
jgi:hypothetical protein